jgi:glutathione S-transferase
MIEIYHAPRARSNRVIWLAEEMGLAYQARIIKLGDKPPEILAHNPGATVPLMIDGGTVLFESVTIMEYLAETYGPTDLVLAHGEPGYWDFRQLLLFGEATLAGPLNAIVGTTLLAPHDERRNFTTGVIREGFKKRLGVIAKRLETSDYVAGGRFTIADISAVYAIILALQFEIFGLKDTIAEELVSYAQRLIDRPAYQRMLAVK